MEQERYYFVRKNGNTDGPYTLRALALFFNRKEINKETLVCREGAQEWVRYIDLIASKANEQTEEDSFFTTHLSDMEEDRENTYSSDGVSGAFRGVGIVCFVLAVLVPLLLLIGGNGQTIFAAAIFLVLALSGLGWLGVGVIIRLLEQIAQNTEK